LTCFGVLCVFVIFPYYLFSGKSEGNRTGGGGPETNYPINAVCFIAKTPSSSISGSVVFTQTSGSSTSIKAKITGLPKGLHGFHIHEYGNLTQGCTSAGSHFNPFYKPHSGPQSTDRHVGDLGNIESLGEDQEATLILDDSQVKLHGGLTAVGRSIVIHADEDDFGKGGQLDSLTTGHAGARLACCVIGNA